jgi:hypothetical protein
VETVSPRARRSRGAQESLLSITLGLESFVVFFAALAGYSLQAVNPTLALVGGGVLLAAFLLCSGVVRTPAGRAVGWVLQLALIATGVVLPLMYLIGTLFFALWIWCFVKGASLDRAKAAAIAADPQPSTVHETKETPA